MNIRAKQLAEWARGVTPLIMGLILALATPVGALTRVRDIARPLGERTNKLWNLGLVVGLNGKGDGGDVLITARPLMTLMQKMVSYIRSVLKLIS